MRIVIIFIAFFALLLFQSHIVPFFSFGTFKPDLIAILITIVGISLGKSYGMISGFTAGLIFDLFTAGLLGLSSFSKTINGFVAGLSYKEHADSESMSSFKLLLIIFYCSLIDNFLYNFIGGATLSLNIFNIIINDAFLPAMYTTIISFPIVFIKDKFSL